MGTRWTGTAAERRALDAYIRLLRCAWSVQGRLDRRLAGLGLTESRFGVLETLFHLGPLPQGELAARQFTSGANLTLVLDNLERGGLVRRERLEQDRRVVVVHLEPAGRSLVAKVLPGHVEAIVALFAALRPAEQERLGMLCRKLGLSAKDAGAPAPARRAASRRPRAASARR